MTVENEPLRLLPHTFDFASDGHWVINKSNGIVVPIPHKYQSFFQQIGAGASIAQMIQNMRLSEAPGRFSLLVHFLCFLYENDLLADPRVIELVETLRPDTVWPASLATAPIANFEVVSFPDVPHSRFLGFFAAAAAVALGAFTFVSGLIVSLQPRAWAGLDPLTAVRAFVAVFFIGRSARVIFRALMIWIATGRRQSIFLAIDPISVHFSTSEVSRQRARLVTLVIAIGSLFIALTPLFFVRYVSAEAQAAVITMSWLVLLIDHSPFSRSEWTDWLRALYNFRDRRINRRGSNAEQADLVQILLISSVPVWIVGLAAYLVMLWWPMAQELVKFWQSKVPIQLAAVVLFGVWQFIIFASLIEEIVMATLLKYGKDVRQLRKTWRRRQASNAVGELVTTDNAPLRADLEKLPFLRQIDVKTRARLLDGARVVTFKSGQAVCRQGDRERALYVILSGRFAVAKRTAGSGASRRKIVALLEPGAVFGEAAFFFGQPRSADVVATEPARLLKIPHDQNTMSSVDLEHSAQLQTRVWFLQALVSSSLFKDLPSEALDALLMAGRHVAVKAGKKVITEGEAADACYFIVQGKASVMQNMKLINRLQNGDVFGEIALLKPQVLRTASVVAASDLMLMAIDSERFWKLLSSHLPLALEIERIAESRLNGRPAVTSPGHGV